MGRAYSTHGINWTCAQNFHQKSEGIRDLAKPKEYNIKIELKE
jgi:hypothetical protein